ncbi:DUF2007 domain-containing protein [Thiomonas sp.]|jgi:hypothetical protein|uniref:putative signal transducing protein n=1 Tax=Thiomonas sp. TaxID=2047785 RepID=UPI0025859603|nr:DUF2007 domain-containing protein [Thiomonas sp.]
MKRLCSAPNLVIATLWADALNAAGYPAQVFSRYLSGIAGEIPPDQALPTVWLMNETDLAAARALLDALERPRGSPPWSCPQCGERHPGQFTQCWRCGRQQLRF